MAANLIRGLVLKVQPRKKEKKKKKKRKKIYYIL